MLAAIATLGTKMGQIDPDRWLVFLVLQIGLGPVAGTAVGKIGGRLLRRASDRGWVQPVFERLSALALALLAYAFGELIQGNGFIAAFVAGLTLGVKQHRVREHIERSGEVEGTLLSYLIFMLFGAVMVPQAIQYWDGPAFLYAALSLTAVRMIPVYIAMIGTGLKPHAMLLLGWFGLRGIASVLYLLIVISEIGDAGIEYPLSIVVLTVLLSVLLHGATANLLARLAAKQYD